MNTKDELGHSWMVWGRIHASIDTMLFIKATRIKWYWLECLGPDSWKPLRPSKARIPGQGRESEDTRGSWHVTMVKGRRKIAPELNFLEVDWKSLIGRICTPRLIIISNSMRACSESLWMDYVRNCVMRSIVIVLINKNIK